MTISTGSFYCKNGAFSLSGRNRRAFAKFKDVADKKKEVTSKSWILKTYCASCLCIRRSDMDLAWILSSDATSGIRVGGRADDQFV
jgi:hypothetical protein